MYHLYIGRNSLIQEELFFDKVSSLEEAEFVFKDFLENKPYKSFICQVFKEGEVCTIYETDREDNFKIKIVRVVRPKVVEKSISEAFKLALRAVPGFQSVTLEEDILSINFSLLIKEQRRKNLFFPYKVVSKPINFQEARADIHKKLLSLLALDISDILGVKSFVDLRYRSISSSNLFHFFSDEINLTNTSVVKKKNSIEETFNFNFKDCITTIWVDV